MGGYVRDGKAEKSRRRRRIGGTERRRVVGERRLDKSTISNRGVTLFCSSYSKSLVFIVRLLDF